MHCRHRRDRLLVDAIVDVMSDSAENENENENDQQVNRQADKTPEMMSASFEERTGVKLLSGIVSSQNSTSGEDGEDCKKDCSQQGSRYRSTKWRFGSHRKRRGGSEIESAHKLIGGHAVVQNRADAFVGPASSEIGQHKIRSVK